MILKQVSFSVILFFLLNSCNSKYPILFEKESGLPKHPRGLYVLNDSSWATSGYDGVFEVYSEFSKKYSYSIEGMEDLRDIQLLEDGSAVLMNSGNLGRIWRYFPENDSLALTYKKDSVFLDGMDFWNNQFGMAFGDPVNGKLTILRTEDSSQTWKSLDYNLIPDGLEGEAGFAASGSGINCVGYGTVYIGTGGGKISRLYTSKDFGLNWDVKNTPMKSDTSYGIYSMYFWSENEGVIIGGSYKYPSLKDSICFYTQDAGDTWQERTNGLGGYCSSIHGSENGDLLIATGRTGTYITRDKGVSWQEFSDDQFYSVRYHNRKAYFSGRNGQLKVLDITALEK